MDKGTDLIFPPANKSTSFTKIRIYTTNLPPSSHKWKKIFKQNCTIDSRGAA
jgi:hypothetical protein